MKQSTAENIIESYIDDYETFAGECIHIRDHNTGKILPLIFNKGQQILHAVSEKMKAQSGYVRIMLLKSRRFGGSTYIEGRFYWRSSLNFNRNTFIVGHEEKSTNILYEMAKLMQQKNPCPPQTLKSNAQELVFDNRDGTGLKSQYQLATAKNLSAGRSQGIHYLHDSEEAYWSNANVLLNGLLQCVPDPPSETEIYRESTAQGYGNSFQEDVFKAYCEGKYPYYSEGNITYAWYNPDSDYILVFIPWFVHERYTKEFQSEQDKHGFIQRLNAQVFNQQDMKWEDSEAKRLKEKCNLSLEQMYWREWAIENKCRGSIEIFHQEYPSTVEEAFLSQGTNVFPKSLCDDVEKLCQEPILMGDVVERMGKSKIKPNPHGHFSLWEKPNKDEVYFMTVDSAGGITDAETQDKVEPDPSCIDIYCHRTGKQVAQWHGHIDYDLIADLVELIGNMFFRAKACVELMNHGYTVVADLKRKHYPMYELKQGDPGWLTTKKTKPQMADGLYCMTRDGDIRIMCKETVSEMRTFVEKDGHFNAASGCHDERVDCGGMASQMMRLLPITYSDKRKRPRTPQLMNWRNYIDGDRDMGEYREVRV